MSQGAGSGRVCTKWFYSGLYTRAAISVVISRAVCSGLDVRHASRIVHCQVQSVKDTPT